MTCIVVGIDGHRYKRLSPEEAKRLCYDVQFYLDVDGADDFETSAVTPETYRIKGNGRLDSWYISRGEEDGRAPYYIRLDEDKPEYTPNDEELERNADTNSPDKNLCDPRYPSQARH